MRIHTKVVVDIKTGNILEEEGYNYQGPVAQCAWGNYGSDINLSNLTIPAPPGYDSFEEYFASHLGPTEEEIAQAEQEKKLAEWEANPPNPGDADYYEYVETKPLLDKMREQQEWLGEKHGTYTGAMEAATGKYGDTLTALANRLNAPESKVGFSLGGTAPASFVPRQTVRDIGITEALAQKGMGASMMAPTEQWAYQQENPLYKPEMQYFDIVNQLAQAEENRRYGLPSTLQFGDLSQPEADWMTKVSTLANLTNTGMNLYQGGQDLGWWGGGG